MPLLLALREESSVPLEVDGIRLETVRAQSPDEVKATLIQRGNRQVPLGEFFDVSGSAAGEAGSRLRPHSFPRSLRPRRVPASTNRPPVAADGEIVWQGDCSRVKLIGTHLSSGRVRVEGNAGMHLGAEMTGGEIVVEGNAGDWVGAEMHGGRIHVRGNAGHLVGAVYRGGHRGMTGGEILIDGNAGNEIGHTMRRGTIAVGGRSGDAAGFNMLAGSVLLFGEPGIRPGAGMRRGTIGFLGSGEPPEMLPTFRPACTYRPVFLRFYLRQLAAVGFPVPDECFEAAYRRYCGDFLESGKGEILVRADA